MQEKPNKHKQTIETKESARKRERVKEIVDQFSMNV